MPELRKRLLLVDWRRVCVLLLMGRRRKAISKATCAAEAISDGEQATTTCIGASDRRDWLGRCHCRNRANHCRLGGRVGCALSGQATIRRLVAEEHAVVQRTRGINMRNKTHVNNLKWQAGRAQSAAL